MSFGEYPEEAVHCLKLWSSLKCGERQIRKRSAIFVISFRFCLSPLASKLILGVEMSPIRVFFNFLLLDYRLLAPDHLDDLVP